MISAEPAIGDGARMTPLEKRLARRIHNQRRRLRQMETFDSYRNGEADRKVKMAFMKLCQERWAKIKELEERLANLTNPSRTK